MRTKQTVERIHMYKSKGLKYQGTGKGKGKMVGRALITDAVAKNKPARVQPDRRWFGNTRVVGQKQVGQPRMVPTHGRAADAPLPGA